MLTAKRDGGHLELLVVVAPRSGRSRTHGNPTQDACQLDYAENAWYIGRVATFREVSPRRLSGSEEAELVAAADRLKAAERRVDELMRERDRLIADVVQAGARVTDVADVLKLTRNAVYAALERALGE
jgi:hypothetical protein